jgi:hypothetical protein
VTDSFRIPMKSYKQSILFSPHWQEYHSKFCQFSQGRHLTLK